MVTARQILNANEGGDIESILEDGQIVVTIDLKPVLTLPAKPKPKVSAREDNAVEVRTCDKLVGVIPTESESDAKEIVETLRAMIDAAR